MDEIRGATGLLLKLGFPQFPFPIKEEEEEFGLWRLEEEDEFKKALGKYWAAGKDYLMGTTVLI